MAEAASLGVLEGADVVYVERAQVDMGRHDLDRRVGSRTGAYATALGHAILAFEPMDHARAVLESAPRVRLSDRTLIDIDDLCARLVLVRQRGYAVSDGENAYALQTVAVPLLGRDGRARAAVSLTSRRGNRNIRGLRRRGPPGVAACCGQPFTGHHPLGRRMTTLRLLADDLTGALDSAAEFVGLVGPVHAFWQGAHPDMLPLNAAIDTGTREASEASARTATAAASVALDGAGLPFKKIDSLIRGHSLAELAACFTVGGWTHAVLAPAFPYQGRITRGGQQFLAATPVGPNLVDALRALGLPAQRGPNLAEGITVFDAETDGALETIVAAVGDRRVLWCGTGGLARALAASRPGPALPSLPGPVLGLFGTDQAVTAAQLAACDPTGRRCRMVATRAPRISRRRLARDGIALVSLDLPVGPLPAPRPQAESTANCTRSAPACRALARW